MSHRLPRAHVALCALVLGTLGVPALGHAQAGAAPPAAPAPAPPPPAAPPPPPAPAPPPAPLKPTAAALPLVSLPSAAPSLGGVCDSAAIADAYQRSRPALVEVTAAGGKGLGFLYHSDRHVVTALSLVQTGRAVRVSVGGGEPQPADVVAISTDGELAVLELAAAVTGVAPLAPSPAALAVGAPVLRLGHQEDQHESVFTMVPATVTAISDWNVYTNAAHEWVSGGPVLDCQGRVVGVIVDPWTDRLTRVHSIDALVAEIGQQERYTGTWSIMHPSFGALFHFQPDNVWMGASLGTAIIGEDSWYFPLRLGALGLIGPNDDRDLDRSGARFQLELGVGYRILIGSGDMPVYLVPQVGGAFGYQFINQSRIEYLVTAAGCSAQNPCVGQEVTVEGASATDWHAAPQATLGLGFGYGELSYSLQMDVTDFGASTHQLYIGFQF
jgi:hypothetical protein